jgi:hypothetical protein
VKQGSRLEREGEEGVFENANKGFAVCVYDGEGERGGFGGIV